MKVIRKRFLSLALALMMILSCTMVASAADTSAAPADVSEVELAVSNDGIMPRLTPETIMQGVSTSSVKSGDFVLAPSYYSEVILASYVKVEATVYQLQLTENTSGFVPINVFYIENTNGSGHTFSLGTGYSGGTYKVQLRAMGSGAFSYELIVIK